MFQFSRKKQAPKPVECDVKPVVLVILDGFGIAPPSEGNAIALAKTPNFDMCWSTFPHGELIASGESVGLPASEEGNSEVGHLTIGAGRVIYQSLKRIDMAIEDGTFFENHSLLSAIAHAKKHNSKLHLMGLVGTGEVHSSIKHFYALLELCRRSNVNPVLHIFTDGRDTSPQEAMGKIDEVVGKLETMNVGKIATILGRYWAMDRDRRWERTQKAYEAIVLGKGVLAQSPQQAIKMAYDKDQTDEFIEPTVIVENSKPVGTVDDNDAVIFFNFRVDRPRQLTMAFTLPDFENMKAIEMGYESHREGGRPRDAHKVISGKTFTRQKHPRNVYFASMTEYHKNIPVSSIAFPVVTAEDSLADVLAKMRLKQFHLAESEKERMVTYYFDGMHEKHFSGEDIIIVPSPKVSTYDKKPEMSAYEILEELKRALAKCTYHFIVVNLANPDMVAHTGNIKATVKAIEITDDILGQIVSEIFRYSGTLIITADHGNAEELIKYPTGTFFVTTSEGEIDTEHSNNPVPVIIINSGLRGNAKVLDRGSLSDIAPTILSLMNLPIPSVMKGRNLLR